MHDSGVRFTVDGESVSARVNRGRQVDTLEGKAEVWHNKSAEHMGGMLIRINGLYMFNRWLDSSIPGTVFVELTGKSVDLLTANRDGIETTELRQVSTRCQTREGHVVCAQGQENLSPQIQG
jgi:hypothetical protein